MAGKKEIVSKQFVDGYTSIHPALDFWGENAILSIGQQVEVTFSDGSVDFRDGELTIMNDGNFFPYSKKELAERKLYYNRSMDLPMGRWEYKDIVNFSEGMKNGHKPAQPIENMYRIIRDIFDYYMDFEDTRIYDLLTCFVLYTYFYPLFNAAPILQLWGEMKTGKSKIVGLLALLCFNSVNSANISEASVFRLVEGRRATLLLDESEDLMDSERGKAISNLLLAGYSKGGETYRQEKVFATDRYKTTSYNVFSPKVIANITGVSLAPLRSRTIRIITTGAADKTKANRDINPSDSSFQSTRNKLFRMALLEFQRIEKSRDSLPVTGLNDRSFGIWQGLLTIANIIGKETWNSILNFANSNIMIMNAELSQDSEGVAILNRLFILTEKEGGNLTCSVDYLYKCFSYDDFLSLSSKKHLGTIMTRLGFDSKPKRVGDRVCRSYDLNSDTILKRMNRI